MVEVVEEVDRSWVLAELVGPLAVAAGDSSSGWVVVESEVVFAGSASYPLFVGVECGEFALDEAAVSVPAGNDTPPAADWTCWKD